MVAESARERASDRARARMRACVRAGGREGAADDSEPQAGRTRLPGDAPFRSGSESCRPKFEPPRAGPGHLLGLTGPSETGHRVAGAGSHLAARHRLHGQTKGAEAAALLTIIHTPL